MVLMLVPMSIIFLTQLEQQQQQGLDRKDQNWLYKVAFFPVFWNQFGGNVIEKKNLFIS